MISAGGSSGRLRSIVKSLMLLGANLSQSREFRDLFEDVLTKVSGSHKLQRLSLLLLMIVWSNVVVLILDICTWFCVLIVWTVLIRYGISFLFAFCCICCLIMVLSYSYFFSDVPCRLRSPWKMPD